MNKEKKTLQAQKRYIRTSLRELDFAFISKMSPFEMENLAELLMSISHRKLHPDCPVSCKLADSWYEYYRHLLGYFNNKEKLPTA